MRVSATEADLIALARAIMTHAPIESVEHILHARMEIAGATASALQLVEDALAKGTVRALAELGGFRRFAREKISGRLWDAHENPRLAFSSFSFALLLWLAREPLEEPAHFEPIATTAGDEIVLYLACALLEKSLFSRAIARQKCARASALVWLGFPRMMGAPCEMPDALSFFLIEALQDDLATGAVKFERELACSPDPSEVARLGEARAEALERFLRCTQERPDLATFLVDAARIYLDRPPRLTAFTRDAPLGDRSRASRARGTQLRAALSLARAHEDARHTRHFDDDYARSQLLLARWEHLGNDGFARVADVVARLEEIPGD